MYWDLLGWGGDGGAVDVWTSTVEFCRLMIIGDDSRVGGIAVGMKRSAFWAWRLSLVLHVMTQWIWGLGRGLRVGDCRFTRSFQSLLTRWRGITLIT